MSDGVILALDQGTTSSRAMAIMAARNGGISAAVG